MKIRKSQFVFYACLSFIIGVAIATFFVVEWQAIFVIGIVSIIILIFSKPKSTILLIAYCLLFFILGIIRYQFSIPIVNENHLAFYNNLMLLYRLLKKIIILTNLCSMTNYL